MAANDRYSAHRGGMHARVYPISLQQTAAAIFGITSLGEQSGPSRPDHQSDSTKPTGKISENQ